MYDLITGGSDWTWENGDSFPGSFADNIDGDGYGDYPWYNGEPGNAFDFQETRVHLGPAAIDYAWEATLYDSMTTNVGRAICNHCNGVINKYIISRDAQSETISHGAAFQACKSNWNTTLASIHSDRDLNEARVLCGTSM